MALRGYNKLSVFPVGVPLVADGILEIHAARLLLLLKYCGKSGVIDGLTKLAKLDFFVRYPSFFFALQRAKATGDATEQSVESAMIRHHYGPWDPRYYQVLAYLEARNLVAISRENRNLTVISLTALGSDKALLFSSHDEYESLIKRMDRVGAELGKYTGTHLKQLVYKMFRNEVTNKRKGEVIR